MPSYNVRYIVDTIVKENGLYRAHLLQVDEKMNVLHNEVGNRIETATNWFSYNGLKKYLSDTIGIKLPYLKDLILFKKTGSREIYVIKLPSWLK